MTNLEDKLREILRAASISSKYGETREATYRELTAQIKQAFKDEGYVDVSRMLKMSKLLEQQAELLKNMAQAITPPIYGTGLMTGQEWYERFEKELGEIPNTNAPRIMNRVLEAAKSAAGIEE